MLVKVLKDSVVYQGELYKTNDEFECDKAIAESLQERGIVTPLAIDVEVNTVEDTEDDLSSKTIEELRAITKDLGLSSKGKKEDLIKRIEANELPNTEMPE